MGVLRLLLEILALAADDTGSSSCDDRASAVSFMALQHHPAQFDSPKEASDWAKSCTIFRGIVERCSWCPWTAGQAPARPPTDAELYALVSRIDSNCFGVYRSSCEDGKARTDARGRNVELYASAIYLDASLFNHSCAPSCSVTTAAAQLEVVVDEAIDAGGELTIAYCDVLHPLAFRQKYLRRAYHFDCRCVRCVAEAAGTAGDRTQQVKLSYRSGGGTKAPPTSKRERRERREGRAAAAAVSHNCAPASGASQVDVHVEVDLRVLLKLAPKKKEIATTDHDPHQHARSKKNKKHQARQALNNPEKVPVCCVFLRCKASLEPACSDSLPRGQGTRTSVPTSQATSSSTATHVVPHRQAASPDLS
jgi:hypothetical protein